MLVQDRIRLGEDITTTFSTKNCFGTCRSRQLSKHAALGDCFAILGFLNKAF
jgi:hypothetical protein